MSQLHYKNPKAFPIRKVSVDQAIKILGRNGIWIEREKAEIILDFLYLIAKTYKTQNGDIATKGLNLKSKSNT